MLPLLIRVELGAMAMKKYSPKLRDWSLSIRLFHVISRTLTEWWGSYSSAVMQSVYLFYNTSQLEWISVFYCIFFYIFLSISLNVLQCLHLSILSIICFWFLNIQPANLFLYFFFYFYSFSLPKCILTVTSWQMITNTSQQMIAVFTTKITT